MPEDFIIAQVESRERCQYLKKDRNGTLKKKSAVISISLTLFCPWKFSKEVVLAVLYKVYLVRRVTSFIIGRHSAVQLRLPPYI